MSATEKLPPANPTTASIDISDYRRLLGLLQYLSFTRPDICFAVHRLSQFLNGPVSSHWFAAKRLLRYLKGTSYHGLYMRPTAHLSLTTFSDADWGSTFHSRMKHLCPDYFLSATW
ncbi:unnamed protein product [Cuscuta epithymum]|uniref:Reverse transcriptase Ty1/copia-type domain-containing protein n=1 Tax=Cuscuta epithymum TaxID=186058 RepID=A0AAV0CWP7_9ASTE|nr:unnamed protein product [Cuscuta epithymum]